MYTLGINAAFHDSSASLIKDGQVLAAVEEERFTHIKHGKRPVPFSAYELPYHSIDYCLEEAGINLSNVDHIAYSYDPSIRLKDKKWDSPHDPLFLSYITNAPKHLADGVPLHLKKRFKGITKHGPFKWHFVDHHIAHAASAFYPSPFEEAAILTMDGRGELATTTFGIGKDSNLTRISQVDMPHSLGILYEKLTSYLGFLHSSDEYKVMALASFGKPKYLDFFRQIININKDGIYSIKQADLVKTFGPARDKGGKLTQKHYDIASSLQAALEEAALKLTGILYQKTGLKNLTMAGGVALNCVMNARIRDKGPFKNVWIQPAAGDAGTSLGAALWVDASIRKPPKKEFIMDCAYLGPAFSNKEIEQFLKWAKVSYRKIKNVPVQTAKILFQDKIIGWFQGRMEFGPRALGARSILASPINPKMQAKLNHIKDREDFRPVAPVVLEEEASNWFKGAQKSPFMLFINDVLPEKVNKIPAVKHVDGTARIQTINRAQNSLYYDTIKAFEKITGVPVLVNTSFNTRGEPIVCSPKDAIECFYTSPLDALVIGTYLLEKR